MIKQIKLNNLIHTNIEPYYIDEEGNKQWNIPSELDELRSATIDTFNWLIGQEVKKTAKNFTGLSASNSKAIALLVKIIDAQSPNLDNLTDLEKSAYDKMLNLANAGYSDSELLNNVLDAVTINIASYSEKIDKALEATTVDELIALLSE
jgi:hypothetical protein